MTITIRHAWLQKHPSPAAIRGEFHWYPAEGDRELRASFVERSRGVDAPAVLWQLAPGRVSWARVFAATAPVDGRRYTGLVLSIAEGEGASPAELLEALEVPEAAPWSEGPTPRRVTASADRRRARAQRWSARDVGADEGAAEHDEGSDFAVDAVAAGPPRAAITPGEDAKDAKLALEAVVSAQDAAEPWGQKLAAVALAGSRWGRDGESGDDRRANAGAMAEVAGMGEVAAMARALLGGGDALLAEPDREDLPRLVASVERWMPPMVAGKPRWGAWRTGTAPQVPDRVAGLVAVAWQDPGSRAARGWTLLCELAAAKARTLDELVGELGATEQPAAALTEAERAAIGEARDFAATLHAWGRGRLDASASAATLPTRLADVVALRVLACLMADRDPRRPIAEARWHALLPAARRTMLLDTVVRRAASLRSLVEVSHA
jgi:hypothetical protein